MGPDLDETLMETEEELKISLVDFSEEEVSRKLIRCKECNRQRFNHPGGIRNFGQGKCTGLVRLELGSKELKADDLRVAKERETTRGTKRTSTSDIDESNSKRLKQTATENSGNSQEMMFQMMMKMMQQNDQQRKEDRDDRIKERELELKARELEMKRQEEILKSLTSNQPSGRDSEREDFKIPSPPTWSRLESFNAYRSNVEAWDKAYFTSKPFKKNQLLLESLKNNLEHEGLNHFIVNEIIENTEIKKDEELVTIILDKVAGFANETTWKVNADLVKVFYNFKQEDGETPKQYLMRFELLEAKLRNHKAGIENTFLANVFLYRSNLTESDKKNVMSGCKLNDKDNVLKDIKASFRDLTANENKEKDIKITLYGDRGRSEFRENRN